QAGVAVVAGLSALPFAIVDPRLRVLGVVTVLLAAALCWLARNPRRGRRWAWRWVVSLELLCLAIAALRSLLPIGAVRGPVPALVNLVIPMAVVVLLAGAKSDARGAA